MKGRRDVRQRQSMVRRDDGVPLARFRAEPFRCLEVLTASRNRNDA